MPLTSQNINPLILATIGQLNNAGDTVAAAGTEELITSFEVPASFLEVDDSLSVNFSLNASPFSGAFNVRIGNDTDNPLNNTLVYQDGGGAIFSSRFELFVRDATTILKPGSLTNTTFNINTTTAIEATVDIAQDITVSLSAEATGVDPATITTRGFYILAHK